MNGIDNALLYFAVSFQVPQIFNDFCGVTAMQLWPPWNMMQEVELCHIKTKHLLMCNKCWQVISVFIFLSTAVIHPDGNDQ